MPTPSDEAHFETDKARVMLLRHTPAPTGGAGVRRNERGSAQTSSQRHLKN